MAVASPNSKPRPDLAFVEFRLEPDEAISIDCPVLQTVAIKPEFTDGFAVIKGEAELDVIAVYTAGSATGKWKRSRPGRFQLVCCNDIV